MRSAWGRRGWRRGGRVMGRRGPWGEGGRRKPGGPPEPWMTQLVGVEHSLEETVVEAATARTMGSGDVDVLGTPALLAIVERAAVAALAGKLPAGKTSVGAQAQVHHVAPSPVGARVRAQVRVEGAQGRRLLFAFRVTDPGGEVARGRHARAIVDRAEFERSAASRPR